MIAGLQAGVVHARPERLWDIKKAEAIRKKCLGKHGTVERRCLTTAEMAELGWSVDSRGVWRGPAPEVPRW